MLSYRFRPWGKLNWVLEKIPNLKWDVLGCISTEERCLGVLQNNSVDLKEVDFLKIIDPPYDSTKLADKMLQKSVDLFCKFEECTEKNISKIDLLAPADKINGHINAFIDRSSQNVILDVSCFPKRFFFPFIKKLIQQERIKNLIITYSTPEKYHEGELSHDPDTWKHLPMFVPSDFEKNIKKAIVGVGFMPFGLPKLLKDSYSEIPVNFFFPFPPGPPNYQRTWEFMRKIEESYPLKDSDLIERVNAIDVTDAFNQICYSTNFGEDDVIFAPYGPKPISIAMCLYASLTDSAVYYTQPRRYNPNYSSGIETTLAYCIKVGGKLLYDIKKP